MFVFLITAAAYALGMAVPKAQAAFGINKQINYQGKLMDGSGQPVGDGIYQMQFKLYNQASGGSHIWSASTTNGLPTGTPADVAVNVQNGLFTVLLGDTVAGQVPLDIDWNNDTIFLGVKIATDTEMVPRKRLTAVPYALNAMMLQGQYASNTVDIAGGVLFSLNQTASDSAVATRTALFIESLGTSNQFDYLVRMSNGSSDVFTVNRLGNATTTGSFALGGNLSIQGIRLDSVGSNPLTSGAYLVGVYDEFTFSSATTVQAALKDLDTAIGNVSSSAMGLTLQDVTNNGNTTTNPLIFAGGTSTASLYPSAHLTYNLGGQGRRWYEVWTRFVRLGASSWTLGEEAGGDFYIADDLNGERFRIDGLGNVGIGTSTPSAKLEVEGDSIINGTLQFEGGTSTGNLMPGAHLTYDLGGPGRRWDEIWIRRTRIGTDSWTIETDFNNTFLISEDSFGNYFAITEDGRVGIGTSTPSLFDLEVNGTIGPSQHNLYDLGSLTSSWRNILASGTVSSTDAIFGSADIGSLSVTTLTVGSQLDLSELIWTNATGTNSILGNLTVTSTLSLPNNSVTDAMASDTLTIGALGNVSATSINSGVLGNANVVLSLDSFGSITGSLPASQISLASINTPNNLDLQSYLNMLVANGRAYGGETIQTASGTLMVTAGEGLIASDPTNPGATVYYTSWATSTGINVPLFEWLNIYVHYNSGSPVIVATTTDYAGDWTYYSLAKVYNHGDGNLHIHDERSIETRPINRIIDFLENGVGQVVTEGCIVSATGTRGIAVSQCINWYASYERTISAFNTGDGDKFDVYYLNGIGGYINVHDYSQWDNLYYDDNSGTLQAIGPGEFGVHWVYRHEHGSVSLVYGRDSYTDLAEASSVSAPVNLPADFLDQEHAFLIGAIIFEQGTDVPAAIRDLRPVLVSRDGSSGGGSSSISNHNDLSGLQGGSSGQYYHLSATGFNAGNSLYFSSNNGGAFSLLANATTNTKITINNAYAGTASLDIIEGDLLLASTTRITNAGAAFFTNLNLSSNLYVSGTSLLTTLTVGDVTSTNLFASSANFTNASAGLFNATELFWTNATGTSAFITKLTGYQASFTDLVATNATFTQLVVMDNTTIQNLTFSNATGGNLVTYGTVSSTYIYVANSELGYATAHNMVVDQSLRVGVGDFPIVGDSVAQFGGTVDSYLQVNLQNHSSGTNASGDYIVTADIGDDSNYYVDLGINSSNYSNPDFSITGPLDAYLYANSANLTIGTATASSAILFHAGGTELTDEVMRITADHYVGIGTSTPSHTLDVDGDGRFTGLLTLSSATTSEIFWGDATGTSLYVTGLARLPANTMIGGISVCLLDGTNCPSSTSPNLQTVTNTGNATTNWIQFAGGTSTADFWMQQNLIVSGNVSSTSALFINATGTYIDFINTGDKPAYFEGRLFYDQLDTSLAYYNEVSGVTVNIAEESIIKVYNDTGSVITNGQVVYITGADNDSHPTIELASAASSSTARIMGMATHDIGIGDHGYITRFGKVHFLDTSSFASGTSLYLSAVTPGYYTATRPESPGITVEIGVVVQSHATEGIILVSLGSPRNGRISDGGVVFGTSNDFMTDDADNFYWNNTSKRLGLGTDNPSSTLHVVGTTQVQGIQFTHATGNSMNISGLIVSDTLTVNTATSSNLIWTNATGTSLRVTGPTRLSSDTRINGILPCLADGTNCPSAAAATLQTVTNAGNTTTHDIQFAGGTSTANFRFQSDVWIDGNVSSTSALFINATGTNLALLGYINSNLSPAITDTYTLGDATHRWQGLVVNYVTSTNVLATGYVSSSAIYINGQAVTTSVPTLNQVTTQGNVTANAIQFGGGTSTGDLYLQQNLNVLGQTVFGNASGTNLTLSNFWSLFTSTTNALFINATGTNFALTGKVNSDLIPMINETYDLGSINYRWKDLFAANADFTNVTTTNFIVTGNVNLGSTSGTVVLQSDFNIESSAATAGVPWTNTNATSTNIESVRSLTVFNDYLYAGQGDGAGDGDIIMCDPTIGGNPDICDLAQEWSSSYNNATASRVNTLLSYKGRLYAGEGDGPGLGQVRYCRPELTGNSAMCESGDWASASFPAGPYRVSQLISMHNVLYAANDDGVTGNAAVAVCNPGNAGASTDCDNAADWTNVTLPVTIYEEVPTLNVFNNRLYAFTGNSTGDNDIFVCTPNAGGSAEYCDVSADWARALNNSGVDSIESSAVYNGFMFFGTGNDASEGDLWSCDPSLAGDRLICDNATDLTLIYDSATMNRMTAMMAYSGSLYFGGEGPTGDGDIYEYYVSYTSTSHPTAVFEATYAFAQYKGYLYAGRGNATGKGQVWYYRKSKGASGKIQMTAADTVGSFWFDEESFNGLGEGAVEEYSKGSFKFSHGIITDAGAYDLAEVYPTMDSTLQAGDVVALDEANYGMVRKSTLPYEQKVLGVVSSKPGFTLSGPQDGDSRAIALIGRVPVKISTENGEIKVGDPLTSATMPGYAMKATKPGMIIGRAMEDFVSGEYSTTTESLTIATGTIRMVVQSGYYFGSEETSLGQIAGFLGETTSTQIIQQAFDGDEYAIEQVAGGIVNPQYADGSALNDVALAQLDVLIVKTAALVAGDLTVGGNTKLAGRVIVSNDTAGVVDLPAGDDFVEIKFANPFETVPVVVVTPESDAQEYFSPWLGKFRIAKKTINGFRIEVDEGACQDPNNCGRTMKFNWIAVGVLNQKTAVSTSTSLTTSTSEQVLIPDDVVTENDDQPAEEYLSGDDAPDEEIVLEGGQADQGLPTDTADESGEVNQNDEVQEVTKIDEAEQVTEELVIEVIDNEQIGEVVILTEENNTNN